MAQDKQPPQPSPASSRVREHLANERTFLAWIRTALGLIGLGFVLARMGLFLRQLAAAAALAHIRKLHAGQEFLVSGLVFLILGTVLSGWAGGLYHRTRLSIDEDRYEPAAREVLALTIVMVIGGLLVVGLVLWRTLESDWQWDNPTPPGG